MRVDIAYVANNDVRMEFGGNDDDLHYLANELREYTWEYNLGISKTRVSSFTRKPKEMSFPVGVAAKTNARGLELRNQIAQLGEYDVSIKRPGKLYIGDWYLYCWIIGAKFNEYWWSDRVCEIELTLLTERPEWTKEYPVQFEPTAAISQGVHGADFEFDFDYDFMASYPDKETTNSSIFPADFIWRAYGPCTNPYIRVGDNLYQVDVNVPHGAHLEVNSRDKTATLIGANGTATSVYAERTRGYSGSGSYLFEPIKPGFNQISWDNTFIFDLVTLETRSLAPFEEG